MAGGVISKSRASGIAKGADELCGMGNGDPEPLLGEDGCVVGFGALTRCGGGWEQVIEAPFREGPAPSPGRKSQVLATGTGQVEWGLRLQGQNGVGRRDQQHVPQFPYLTLGGGPGLCWSGSKERPRQWPCPCHRCLP